MSTVQIYCTDKQRHRKLQIMRVHKVHGDWRELIPDRKGDPGSMVALTPRSFDPNLGIHRLQCRRCGRDTRVNSDTMTKILDGLTESVVTSLDLSYLPF